MNTGTAPAAFPVNHFSKSDMALTNEQIQEKLTAKFGDQVTGFEEPWGLLSFEAPREINLKVLNFLYDDPELKFRFLTDLCGVHDPAKKGKELTVVYHLHNLEDNVRLRFRVTADINQPDIYTATGLFSSANWMERETYDFYGVNFVGHPNLKRILNVDEMEYFPMRKEFPLEDQSRIDKDDEMFGRGGTLGFGTEKSESGTVTEAEKHDAGEEII
ncbi:NADH-quinone oxidoreductase subunit C [Nostoc ellipsosporum NOK]|nr:NADH-quinone oxidoreductase subunit C [Nostoc ellipsosporum NOK]